MRRIRRKLINLGLILILAVGLIGSSWLSLIGKAASCTFSVSGDEVEIGEVFTLTLSCTEEGATLVTYMGEIVYDPAYLEYQGDASSLKDIVENEGFKEINLTFKALKAGTTTVKFVFTDSALGENADSPIVEMTANSKEGVVVITEPTTEAPTAPPTTEEPATIPPATEEPTTAPPATEEPTTTPPATEEPTTAPPATEEPTTTPPATEAPSTQAPGLPSNNAYLDDLSVYPGTLSPAFDPNEMYYEVTVGHDVTKITVDAVTADVDAEWKINVWGSNDNLQVGRNIIDIKVTAADGTVRWYAIYVIREEIPTTAAPDNTTEEQPTEPETEEQPTEADPLQVVIGSITGRVQETLGTVSRPEGFEETTYTYNGVQVEALKGIGKNLLLLPISDGIDTKLYIYDADKNGFYPYVGIQITSALYTVLPFDSDESIPDGYQLSAVEYRGTLIDAWIRTDATDSTYAVFYAMNWDGEISLYRYDTRENTLQRVNKSELTVKTETSELPAGSTAGTENSENGGSSQVSSDYLDYYEETLKKVNRRDTIMFIIMVIMLASMIAMYLLFVVKDPKEEGEPEDPDPEDGLEDASEEDDSEEDIEDGTEDELGESTESAEADDRCIDPEEEILSEKDAEAESAEENPNAEKQIEDELAFIVAGMADFMAELDEEESESTESAGKAEVQAEQEAVEFQKDGADAEPETLEEDDLEDDDLEELDFDNLDL